MSEIIKCLNLTKTYKDGENVTEVLKNINININQGEMVGIIGKSGSGKSTLLHILGGLDTPTSGESELNGQSWQKLKGSKKDLWRNKYLGVIYQQHFLMSEFSAEENVAMPLIVRGESKKYSIETARKMLDLVGLTDRAKYNPNALSGGERQRVSIARALVTNPKCILADEPTGNLDSKSAQEVFSLINNMCKELGTTLVLVTHDLNLAKKMDRVIKIVDGQIEENQ